MTQKEWIIQYDNCDPESLYKWIKYSFARVINILMFPMFPHQFIQDLICDQHSTVLGSWYTYGSKILRHYESMTAYYVVSIVL